METRTRQLAVPVSSCNCAVSSLVMRYTIHNKWGVMAGFAFLGDAMRFTTSLHQRWSMWDNDTGKLVLSKDTKH